MRRVHAVAVLLALCAAPRATRGQAEGEPTEDAGPSDDAGEPTTPGPSAPPAGAPPAAQAAWLAARVDAAWAARAALAPARFGALVTTLDGEELVARRADDGFAVASNAKLVTAAAALATLGPAYRWKTELLGEPRRGATAAQLRGERFPGDLVLMGGGDPTLDVDALAGLADAVVRRGWRAFDGSLVVDTGFFDEDDLPPAFAQKTEDAAFRAPVAGVSLAASSVVLRVLPGATAGAPARVTSVPASAYVVVKNEVTTVARGRTVVRAAASAATGPRGAPTTEILLRGTVRLDAGEIIVRKRVEHPAHHAGEALRALLAARGVSIARPALVLRRTRTVIDERTVSIAVHDSPPLAEVVRHLGKRSDNFTAEVLLKTMGAVARGTPGTWAAGLEVARAWLAAAGATGELRFDNGSGLYDSNQLSPRQLVAVLRAAWADFRIAPDFAASLAIAGVDGTLVKRLAGTRAAGWVRAKTGTLDAVVSLCGYAGAPGKPPLAFCVMVNDLPPGTARHARAFADAVAADVAALHAGTAEPTPASDRPR